MKDLAIWQKKLYNIASIFERWKEKGIGIHMKKTKMMALLLCGALTASMFAGCGTQINKTATVATYGDTAVSLGLANFAARVTQAQYDDFYVSYFGNEVWSTDMYGYGTTMEDDLKTSVMDSILVMYALEEHMADYGVVITEEDKAAINEAAVAFVNANSAEALEALGATTEIVAEYLELLTIQSRMQNEIVKAVDTNVSDEEAQMSSYSYVRVSRTNYLDEEGKSMTHTEESLAELATTMDNFMKTVAADGFDAAAEASDYNVYEGAFNAASTDVDAKVLEALKGLAEGEVSNLIETDTQYYVVRLDAVVDEEATENNREGIIADRESKLYSEVVDGYMKDVEWNVNEKVWNSVSFNNLFTIYEPTTETVETTEAE